MKQGLDADISSMTQAEKAMLRYQYVMAQSNHIMGDFARTSDTYHNTLTRLKANFMTLKGTVGTSLMNLFKPVLVLVNNAIVVINRFAKAVGDSLGKILGWKYEVGSGAVALDDAADYAEDLEGGLGGAGKAAKDLKRQLQGFDELNNLTSNDDNGGGGGGGGGAGGVGAGGASDLAGRWVREESLFESEWDTWFKLGRGISEAWTDGLNSIPWDSVYEKAREFGKGFADFLNGLFTPELFGAVGKTIAGSLNTAVYAALAFGETLNWKQMGDAIASGINNYFATFDFVANAKAISTWAKGILDMLIQAVEKTDWAMIGTKIGDFIANLDIPGIVSRMVKLAGKIISALGEAFVSLVETDPLSAGIVALLLGAKLSGLSSKLSPLGLSISKGIGSAIELNADPITKTFGRLFGTGGIVFAVVKTAIMGWTIGSIIGKIFEKEIEKAIESIDELVHEIYDHHTVGGRVAEWKDTLMKYTNSGSTTHDVNGTEMGGSSGYFGDNFFKQAKEKVDKFEKINSDMYKNLAKEQKDAETQQLKLQQYYDNKKKNSLKGYTSYAQTYSAKMYEENTKRAAKSAADILATTMKFGENMTTEYESFTGGASDYWDNMSTDILGKNQNLVTNIVSSVGTTKNSFLTNYEAIRSGTTTKMETMKNAIGTIMGTMQKDNDTKISTIASTIKSATNGASTSAQTAFNSMKSNLGTNLSGMNTNTTTSTNSMLSTITTWSKNVKTTVTNTRANATFGVNYEKVSAVQSAINTLKSHWTDKNAKFTVTASTNSSDISSFAGNVLDRLKRSFRSVGGMFARAAENLHLFATGGVAENATLGVFGEAGAEAIVPLERNTKWLGRMSNMLADELAYKNYTPTTYSAPKYTGTTSVVAQTSARSEQATAEQNALLREEVELLRQIAGKEFSVSSRDVFNSVQNESENYYNRTGNSPFIF